MSEVAEDTGIQIEDLHREEVPLENTIADRIRAAFEAEKQEAEAPAKKEKAPKTEKPAETPKAEPEAKEETPEETPEVPTLDDLAALDETESGKDGDEAPEEVKAQGEKAVVRWGELKKAEKERDRLKAENEELRVKLESGDTVKVSKELEELRTKLSEREKVIAAYDVTQSDEYQRYVVEPMNKLEERARNLTEDPEIEEGIISALAEVNPKRRVTRLAEVTDGMSEFQKFELYRIVGEMDNLFAKREEVIQNAYKAKEEIDRSRLAEHHKETEEQKQARLAASDTVWKNIVKKLPFLTDEEGNLRKEFEEVKVNGRGGITEEMSLGTQAFAGYAAHLVPKMAAVLTAKDSRIKELESSIAALQGAAPSMGNNGSREVVEVSEDLPLEDIIMQKARASGFVR